LAGAFGAALAGAALAGAAGLAGGVWACTDNMSAAAERATKTADRRMAKGLSKRGN